jgi:DNA repair protein RecN (Recombination protein N)
MLARLSLRNLATISDTTLELTPGLNVLTGETGAGKSILVDGLLLALGTRADTALVRPGERLASVEAHFDTADGETIVRREVYTAGRSRMFCDDRLCTLEEARGRVGALVDLHSQRSTPALLSRRTQQRWLDEMAGAEDLAREVAGLFDRYRSDSRRRDELAGRLAGLSGERELLAEELREIEETDPSEEEYRELMEERRDLRRLADMADTLSGASQALAGEEDSLSSAVRDVQRRLASLGDRGAQAAELLEQAAIGLDEAATLCDGMIEEVEEAPWRLEELDSRLDAYSRLLARCGGSIESLMGRRETLVERLGQIEDMEREHARLQGSIPDLEGDLLERAGDLSRARTEAARRLETGVAGEMEGLGMPDSTFLVRMDDPRPSRSAQIEGRAVCADGLELPAFAFSANPGMEPGPLSAVASGGELSRLALALRLALADVRDHPTMAFDEIDAGVGGRTAHLLAESLARAASGDRQILVITHLAQIAARARNHLAVSKRVESGMPVTEVRTMCGRERLEELARILGGGEAALEHARSMLEGAEA